MRTLTFLLLLSLFGCARHEYRFVEERGYPAALSPLYDQPFTVREDLLTGQICVVNSPDADDVVLDITGEVPDCRRTR